MKHKKELIAMKKLAIKAGEVIMDIYTDKSYQVMIKKDKSPVTTADYAANEIIVNGLKKMFPKYAMLSEECSDNFERRNNDYCWSVDPLDGTKEFVKRNGEFSVNIALIYKKRPIIGVVYIPTTSELFSAVEGYGTYYENNLHKIRKIHVTDKLENLTALRSRSRISEKITKMYEEEEKVVRVRKLGSSLKGCSIAKGDAEIYYSMGKTMEWDTAAMEIIVREAGGVFMQLDDSIMQYNRKDVVNRKGFYIINRIENKLKLK